MKTVRSSDSPLRVDFLPRAALALDGRLGMTFAPGKRGPGLSVVWERDLDADLERLGEAGCDVLVSLVEEHELSQHGIPNLVAAATARGIQVVRFPIRDVSIPAAMEPFAQMVAATLADVRAGKAVVVHCLGGKGRTGLVVACCLVARGHTPDEAIALVRQTRPGTVETRQQEAFVTTFAALPNHAFPSRPAVVAAAPGATSSGPSRGRPVDELRRDRYRGCLLAGAAGDALGAAVEFSSLSTIRSTHGAGGIRDLAPAYGRTGAITDDTQMTLFTGEGLLRAWVRGRTRGGEPAYATEAARAYLRWLHTQGERSNLLGGSAPDGWLVAERALHARRAPGNTCLGALRAMKALGDFANNDSKGCGGVMRAAPVGLFVARLLDGDARVEQAVRTGSDVARLTHGHPSGHVSAGALAGLVALLVGGETLDASLDDTLRALRALDGHEETTAALEAARRLAAGTTPTDDAIRALGGGWVGEEALAIAVYSALVGRTLEEAVVLAVNHDGDSDSTGSIAGNLLGARDGLGPLPARWLEPLELRPVITALADDLATFPEWPLGAPHPSPEQHALRTRYPVA